MATKQHDLQDCEERLVSKASTRNGEDYISYTSTFDMEKPSGGAYEEQKKARRMNCLALALSTVSFVCCFHLGAACTMGAILCAIKGYLSAKRRRLADSELMAWWSYALSCGGCVFGAALVITFGLLMGLQVFAYRRVLTDGSTPCGTPTTTG